MKVTFFSNYLNHHQLPFCLEMMSKERIDFKFVATERISDERIKLGYEDMNSMYDFVIRSYDNEEEAYKLADESDVVIFGSADRKYITNRLRGKKITFRYSEHIFKRGFDLKKCLSLMLNYIIKERNVFLLCASAYAAYDYNLAHLYKNRTFKWGYFPKTNEYDIDNLLTKKQNHKVVELLWVGRYLDWKHPEKPIEIARKLQNSGINFSLKMIGVGEEFENMKELVRKYNLSSCVELMGSVPSSEVRKYMENANIFLATSDYNEGWGAVLNEAMNSGCAVVASHLTGSVPFLIKNNYNGLIYDSNDIDDLCSKVKTLILNRKLQYKLGYNAYYTIINEWNVKNASANLLKLIDKIVNNDDNYEVDGPCSIALPISNKKMYNYLMRNGNDKETN